MGFKAPNRNNKQFKQIDWEIDMPTEWVKLSDMWKNKPDAKAKYQVCGLFISKDRGYGKSPVIITKKHLVSLPQHLLDEVKEILDSDDNVEAIKNGEVTFSIYEYKSHGKYCYSVTWNE